VKEGGDDYFNVQQPLLARSDGLVTLDSRLVVWHQCTDQLKYHWFKSSKNLLANTFEQSFFNLDASVLMSFTEDEMTVKYLYLVTSI